MPVTITEALRLAAASQLLLVVALLLRDHRRSRVTAASSLLVACVVCYVALPALLHPAVPEPLRQLARAGALAVPFAFWLAARLYPASARAVCSTTRAAAPTATGASGRRAEPPRNDRDIADREEAGMGRRMMLAALTAVLVSSVFAGAAADGDLQRLAWLEGRWVGEKDGVSMEEYWTDPRGGAMLGLHRDVKGERLVSWEFLRIGSTSEGTFYYASPRSAPPTPFKLVELGEKRVLFENRQHDFPQRILYWLDPQGALHARIEGPQGGKTVSEEWVWTKVR